MQKKRFYKDYTLLANPSLPLEAGPKRERETSFLTKEDGSSQVQRKEE